MASLIPTDSPNAVMVDIDAAAEWEAGWDETEPDAVADRIAAEEEVSLAERLVAAEEAVASCSLDSSMPSDALPPTAISYQPSVVTQVANAVRRSADESGPQRVARPEAPIRVIGPQRGAGQQRKRADGSWEFPRRNVVYVTSATETIELGCGDLRVISVADLKRWIASREGQPPARCLRLEFAGSQLDDAATLSEAGIDYESSLSLCVK